MQTGEGLRVDLQAVEHGIPEQVTAAVVGAAHASGTCCTRVNGAICRRGVGRVAAGPLWNSPAIKNLGSPSVTVMKC